MSVADRVPPKTINAAAGCSRLAALPPFSTWAATTMAAATGSAKSEPCCRRLPRRDDVLAMSGHLELLVRGGDERAERGVFGTGPGIQRPHIGQVARRIDRHPQLGATQRARRRRAR